VVFRCTFLFLSDGWWRDANAVGVVDESLCQRGCDGRPIGLLSSRKPRAGRRAADPAVDKLSRALSDDTDDATST
jgi:hypothetical protein